MLKWLYLNKTMGLLPADSLILNNSVPRSRHAGREDGGVWKFPRESSWVEKVAEECSLITEKEGSQAKKVRRVAWPKGV